LWNEKNLFTGCVDVPLTPKGVNEAIEAGKRICNIPVDVIYTSSLIRAQMTAMLAMMQHRRKKVRHLFLCQVSSRGMLYLKRFESVILRGPYVFDCIRFQLLYTTRANGRTSGVRYIARRQRSSPFLS
jgi:hypothetical protein